MLDGQPFEVGAIASWDGKRRAHAGDCREIELVALHKRLVRKLRMRAWRWSDAVAYPTVHRNQEGSQRPRILIAVRLQLTLSLRREIAAGHVLRTGEQINSDVVRHCRVLVPVERRVSKRGSTARTPIFDRRICIKDFRTLIRLEPHQNPADSTSHRIPLVKIKIWE